MTDQKKAVFLNDIQDIYREHVDDMRASLKALSKKHGEKAVCISIHVANLTRLAIELMPGGVPQEFNEELGKLAGHCSIPKRQIAVIAMGVYEQTSLFKAALDEAGFQGGIPLPGGLTDEGDG